MALQSVAITNTLGRLARPLVAEISCALIVRYRFSAECIISQIQGLCCGAGQHWVGDVNKGSMDRSMMERPGTECSDQDGVDV